MANLPPVAIVLQAKDDASAQIARVSGALGNLKTEGQSAAGGVGQLSTAFGTLQGAVAGWLAASGVSQLASFATDAAVAAGRVGMLRDSLAQLVGTGAEAEAMIRGMQAASQGMISEADLLANASRAMIMGVADSAEELQGLTQAAIKASQQMGISVQYAFESIVTGIARMSPLILDNVGISIAGGAAFEKYADSIGTTVEKLDDAGRKQALVNEVMSQFGGPVQEMNNAATAAAQMAAAWQDTKAALGDLFGPVVTAALQGLTTAAKAVTEQAELGELRNQAYDLALAFGAVEQAQIDLARAERFAGRDSVEYREAAATLKQYQNELGAMLVEQNDVNASFAAAGGSVTNFKRATDDAGDAAANAAPKISNMSAAVRGVVNDAAAASRALSGLTGQINTFFSANLGALGLQESIEGQDELTRKAQAYEGVLRSLGMSESERYLSQKAYVEGLLEPYQAQVDEIEKAERAAVSYGKSVESMAGSIGGVFDDLKGKVGGVLSGSFSLSAVGVDPDKLLPREDAIQEDAFRLADVAVKGFESPWAAYFQSEFPAMFEEMTAGGDIKTGAARILKDFEDGFRPELIDRDKVKENVKRAILGDVALDQLADEITGELVAELGGSDAGKIGELVQQALGVGGGEADLTAGLVTQLNSAQLNAQMGSAGATSGKTWGATFLEYVRGNVPPELITMLTNLVTPNVAALLRQQQTAEGALP